MCGYPRWQARGRTPEPASLSGGGELSGIERMKYSSIHFNTYLEILQQMALWTASWEIVLKSSKPLLVSFCAHDILKVPHWESICLWCSILFACLLVCLFETVFGSHRFIEWTSEPMMSYCFCLLALRLQAHPIMLHLFHRCWKSNSGGKHITVRTIFPAQVCLFQS